MLKICLPPHPPWLYERCIGCRGWGSEKQKFPIRVLAEPQGQGLSTNLLFAEALEDGVGVSGYVAALVEGVVGKRYPDCIPPIVNDLQFALLMRRYLNASPEDLQRPAADGAPDAVAKIFKCNSGR